MAALTKRQATKLALLCQVHNRRFKLFRMKTYGIRRSVDSK
jgi:hypothetical protein